MTDIHLKNWPGLQQKGLEIPVGGGQKNKEMYGV